jgi:hypothetical protein
LSRHAVVGVNIVDPTGARIFVDARVVERGRVIDPFSINSHRQNARIGCGGIDCPRDGNSFCLAGAPSAGASGGEDGVGHATGITIKDDIFDFTDFFALGALDLRADDFARLHVAGAAARGRAGRLGFGMKWSRGQTQNGQRRSV